MKKDDEHDETDDESEETEETEDAEEAPPPKSTRSAPAKSKASASKASTSKGSSAKEPASKAAPSREAEKPPLAVYAIIAIAVAFFGWLVIHNSGDQTSAADAGPAGSSSAALAGDGGLGIEDLVVGTGEEAKRGDLVKVHYTGTLTDGTEFDSSRKNNHPFDFQLGKREVIQGWDLGVAGMKVGGKRKLTIPPSLGYGKRGSPPVIPGNATLLFDVELLEVTKGGRPVPISPDDPLKGNFTLADATKNVKGEGTLTAKIETSMGSVQCRLFDDKAPVTVANFIGLATGERTWKDPSGKWVNKPAYDGTTFHRVIKGFMIQGGDQLGSGAGEPGYVIKDEIWEGAKHDRIGLLCMANRGPNTNGAQFFITEEPKASLDGNYTIFGECSPPKVIHDIAAVPTGEADKPKTPVVIKSVKISRAAQ
jgi:peptidyl-prolyl cis-trans isomerase A (cyclophilin A)